MQRKTILGKFLATALCVASAVFALDASAARGADGPGPAGTGVVSIKVLNTRAPPGGALQFVLSLTEPTPIMTGTASLLYTPIGAVMGVSLLDPTAPVSDVGGTAVLSNGHVTVRTTRSANKTFGMAVGVPILTLTIGVSPTAPRGSAGTLAIDTVNSVWLDPFGNPYPQQVKSGNFQIAGTVSITDVFPGGGPLAAGDVVQVKGVGFQPGAIVEIDAVPVATTTFVSPNEIDVTVGVATDLHARRVRVRNPDFSVATYYSYLRGLWLLPKTVNALLLSTDPIFADETFTAAWFPNTAAAGQLQAVAVQNALAAPADVTIDLVDGIGAVRATKTIPLAPRTRFWRDAAELFGPLASTGAFLVVRSTAPVQVLGVVADAAAGTVVPMQPSFSSP